MAEPFTNNMSYICERVRTEASHSGEMAAQMSMYSSHYRPRSKERSDGRPVYEPGVYQYSTTTEPERKAPFAMSRFSGFSPTMMIEKNRNNLSREIRQERLSRMNQHHHCNMAEKLASIINDEESRSSVMTMTADLTP